jgi:hypothetical protein
MLPYNTVTKSIKEVRVMTVITMQDIMKLAWKYKRAYSISIGSAMKLAWAYFKAPLTESIDYLNLMPTIYVCAEVKGVKGDTNSDETGIEENGYEPTSIYQLNGNISNCPMAQSHKKICRSNPISKGNYLTSGSGIYRYFHPP